MHFDSFQRHIPAPLDMGSSLSHHRAPSQALSTASDATSTYGGDSMGRATVDTTQGFQPRTKWAMTTRTCIYSVGMHINIRSLQVTMLWNQCHEELLSNTFSCSYLRTMTALLDPAQREEREVRRIKQLQHQVGLKVETNPFITSRRFPANVPNKWKNTTVPFLIQWLDYERRENTLSKPVYGSYAVPLPALK